MAAYIPDEKITLIKNASDIVDIISEVVSLRQAGRNFLGLCPFHAEKTPSFTVSPEKQIYYCFGCGAGGNVFSFLMKQNGMTFPEAARALADRCGIDLPTRKMSLADKKKLTERETILTLNAEALAFFRSCLLESGSGKKAMDYLSKRGMTRQTIDDFQLGFAPDGWDHLAKHFFAKKRSAEMSIRSGLVITRKSGHGQYDRFRNRIVFPIINSQGQTVGFGGRVMDDAMPKYLNSPETPVYNKSRLLYGIHKARGKCRERQAVFVVEGYFDLLAMHQFGMINTVATLGTSLTLDHVRTLKSIVGENGKAVLVYDSDQAGLKAAQRSIAVFQKGLLDARILVLPEGHDPDSFLRDNNPDAFLNAAKKSMGMIPFLVESAIEKHGLGIDGKVRIVSELRPILMSIGDPVARSLRIKQLSERIGVEEPVLLQKMRQSVNGFARVRLKPLERNQDARLERKRERSATYRLERQVIAMMLQFPEMIETIAERRFLDYFSDPDLTDIGKGIIKHFTKYGEDISNLITCWEDTEKKSIIAKLSFSDEQWDRRGCLNLMNQFAASIRRRDKTLLQRIEAAEKSGDDNLLAKLLMEKQNQIRRKEANNPS